MVINPLIGICLAGMGMMSISHISCFGPSSPSTFAGVLSVRYIALQEARLFCAYAEGEPEDITLRLQTLQGQLSKESGPKRLLVTQLQFQRHHEPLLNENDNGRGTI
jgi:hypothetical protein